MSDVLTDHRGFSPQRGGLVGPPLLRGARLDPLRNVPAPAIAATARAVLRRLAFIVFAQRIGLSLEEIAGELAALPANSVPGTRGLGSDLGALDAARRRADRRAPAAARRVDDLHRLRVPVAPGVSAGQPRRSRGACRSRATVLDRALAAENTMANGKWQMADGRWQMARRWQMADGGWQTADGRNGQIADSKWRV